MESHFLKVPVKNKEEVYEAIIEMSKNNNYQQVIYWIMGISKITKN